MMGNFDDLFPVDFEKEYRSLKEKYDDLVKEAADYETELDLSNRRTLRQSGEIDEMLDLLKRVRTKVSDSDWTEVLEDFKKDHEGASLIEDKDGNDEN